jgi:ribulose-phosphate 3-epimerase
MVEEAGADMIHVDVMDGHFVSNLTIGPPVVKALKRCATVPLDVHLMIDNPDATVDWYLDAGADWLTVHVEACDDVDATLARIADAGAKTGVSIKPGTPVDDIVGHLSDLDLVLVMSVEPGFGGQSFIQGSLPKIEALTAESAARGAAPLISVDGGINEATAAAAAGAGARMLVAGSAVFGADDPAQAIESIRAGARSGLE